FAGPDLRALPTSGPRRLTFPGPNLWSLLVRLNPGVQHGESVPLAGTPGRLVAGALAAPPALLLGRARAAAPGVPGAAACGGRRPPPPSPRCRRTPTTW